MKNYFYNGNRVSIQSPIESQDDMCQIKIEESYDKGMKPGTFWQVHRHRLEELITDQFQILDEVRTFGSFKGIIIAFDMTTNKLIAVSHKLGKYNDKNVRYAYSADKIQPNITLIEVGKRYLVNDIEICFAISGPCDSTQLVDKHGIVLYSNLTEKQDKTGLMFSHGIETLKEI